MNVPPQNMNPNGAKFNPKMFQSKPPIKVVKKVDPNQEMIVYVKNLPGRFNKMQSL